ncbi:MAG: SURF1 family protein [Betaproteobacteria bacterium]|nr:SURF1 family protein [Betaproteobacteria bacterium]
MVPPNPRPARPMRLNLASGVALLLALLTLSLGFWQWNRSLEKQAIFDAIERQAAQRKGSATPSLGASLPWQLGRPAQDLDRKEVVIRGRWLPDSTFYLDNRLLNGKPGVNVLSAVVLPDQSLVWVNRGWAPKPPGLDNQRARSLMSGGQHLPEQAAADIRAVGLASLLQRLELSSDPQSLRQGALWQNVDWAAATQRVAISTGLKTTQADRIWPLIFWQTSDSPDGLLRQVPAPPSDAVDKHRGYAFQWWMMSLAALVFAWRLSLERRHPSSASTQNK